MITHMRYLDLSWPFNFLKTNLRKIQYFYSNMAGETPIKTFVFMDLETTGLPSTENNKTKITELCMIAIESCHLSPRVCPRVLNKLSLCINPRKLIQPMAYEITGLCNDLLENQPAFSSTTVDLIKHFLDSQPQPLCFVAHNGDCFDYPILREHCHRVGNELNADIYSIDSLKAFKDIESSKREEQQNENVDLNVPQELQDGYDEILSLAVDKYEESQCSRKWSVAEIQKINETTPKKGTGPPINAFALLQKDFHTKRSSGSSPPKAKRKLFVSYRLAEVYERQLGKPAPEAHRAENDVNMLIECAAKFGDAFKEWADAKKRRFCDIPMMQPGSKIGT